MYMSNCFCINYELLIINFQLVYEFNCDKIVTIKKRWKFKCLRWKQIQ